MRTPRAAPGKELRCKPRAESHRGFLSPKKPSWHSVCVCPWTGAGAELCPACCPQPCQAEPAPSWAQGTGPLASGSRALLGLFTQLLQTLR